jgi:hypothetical protein
MELSERLHMQGGSGCRGLPEFPLVAEAILCKIAASALLRLSCSRDGEVLECCCAYLLEFSWEVIACLSATP